MNRAIGGGYHEDERGHYVFSYSDSDGKHVDVRFRAESDYDLDIVFSEFKNFLIASGHDVEGPIGELGVDDASYDDSDEQIHAMEQYQSADKFSMDHLPNNGWPFGGLTTSSIPALTTEQIAALTVKSIDLSQINQYPTMSPITSEQIKSWKFDAPGTIGGVKVSYK
jgi:hypothetical protein